MNVPAYVYHFYNIQLLYCLFLDGKGRASCEVILRQGQMYGIVL